MTETKERKMMEEKCQPGDTVRVIRLVNEERRIGPGSVGRVDHIDDAGQTHVRWECGSRIALLIEDEFEVLNEYCVTVCVEGSVELTVQAASSEDAAAEAEHEVLTMDFGPLVDHVVRECTEVDLICEGECEACNEYCVTVCVEGSVELTVQAASSEDAAADAEHKALAMDFGPLDDQVVREFTEVTCRHHSANGDKKG